VFEDTTRKLRRSRDGHPRGLASLGDGLVSSQAYDVTVHLDLPRSPPNLATGNFMLDLSLVSSAPATLLWTPTDQDVLAHSRRPAILTYESPLVNTIKTTGGALWLFLGWKKEAESIDVPMLESVEFTRGWRTIPKFLRLEIQADEKMMVYKARVSFKARFSGLR
jgi:seipin